MEDCAPFEDECGISPEFETYIVEYCPAFEEKNIVEYCPEKCDASRRQQMSKLLFTTG